jgi:hypothetical protein
MNYYAADWTGESEGPAGSWSRAQPSQGRHPRQQGGIKENPEFDAGNQEACPGVPSPLATSSSPTTGRRRVGRQAPPPARRLLSPAGTLRPPVSAAWLLGGSGSAGLVLGDPSIVLLAM